MASCAAGMASRVYDQNMELVYTFMVGTWGHLFIANKKEEHKNTCEPTNFHTPLGVLCNNTPMDGIQCRGSGGPPFRICVGVLETKGWIHMKGNQNS